MDIAFALNYTNLFMIDVTPSAASPTWARIGAGITSFDPSNNEVIADDAYYDGEGMSFSDVTGGQIVHAFSGHRKYGDPAQDFIASIESSYGEARKTSYKWIAPDGTVLTGNCTIANIVSGGGDPNAKGTFSFEIRFNGRPTMTAGNKDDFPTAITASAITVVKDATTTVGATVTPATANDAMVYVIEDDTVAVVDAAGTVTGVAVGSTNLLIKSCVAPSVTKTIVVTVTAS